MPYILGFKYPGLNNLGDQIQSIAAEKFIPKISKRFDSDNLAGIRTENLHALIKNIEAIGNGFPLITTTHGDDGIEQGLDKLFLVANTARSFKKALYRLIDDDNHRKEIAENTAAFANHFLPEKCFEALRVTLAS